MRSFHRALFAAASIFAFAAQADAADILTKPYSLSSTLGSAFSPASEFMAPSVAGAKGQFLESPFTGSHSEFSVDRGVSWAGSNGLKIMLDAVAVDRPASGSGYLPLGSATALATTLNWNFASWGAGSITATTAQDQAPLFGTAAGKSLGVSAFVGLGQGWVGSFSYGESQLDLKPVSASTQGFKRSTYGVAIAKHGLFGDDMLGLLLSRPSQGQNTTTMLNTVGASTIPSLYVRDRLLEKPADADIQLGYVTSFLDGTLALQTNASYQMNFDSKKPDSVSLLSRAKIKF